MSVFLAKLPFILAAILIFGVLIAVHELGHFLAAKLCGVQVNEFSIGMGPCLWKREKGETQYSLRLLPIGGFCAMEGEGEESESPRALGNQGFWKKLLIFAAGAGMNFLTGLLIIAILFAGAAGFYVDAVLGTRCTWPTPGTRWSLSSSGRTGSTTGWSCRSGTARPWTGRATGASGSM